MTNKVYRVKLSYASNKITVDDGSEKTTKITNAFLKKTYPELSISDNIKAFLYLNGGDNNHIVYTDGTSEDLPQYVENFEQIAILHRKLVWEEEQQRLVNTKIAKPKQTVFLQDIYEAPVKKREDLKLIYQKERSLLLTNDKLYKYLKTYKNAELIKSDWTQLADVQATLSEEDKQAVLEYRSALRTLHKAKDLLKVVIPTVPDVLK